jgi:peptidoglycan/xylan/chitin deacetylase (PgdA/CDA1 family)
VATMPDLFRNLPAKCEIGCHSYAHEWLGVGPPTRGIPQRYDLKILTAEAKVRVVRLAVDSIARITGRIPRSFRAPFGSVDTPTMLQLLSEVGFKTDSSLPCYHNLTLGGFVESPTHHTSEYDLWNDGMMQMIEVPCTVNPRLMPYPFETNEGVLQWLARDVRSALERVDVQCRLDSLSGRSYTVVHITSHPWEFSEAISQKGCGEMTAKRLSIFLDELSARYDVRYLTVSQFAEKWEKQYCNAHSVKDS